MAKTIGIDLGTTNSCMAVLEGGEPTVIPNAEGGRTTPSVVAFTKDGQRLVGAPARRQQVTNPQNTIFSIKRFMGRKFDEVTEEMTIVPYEVDKGPNGDVRVEAEGKEYAPPEISAMILQKLKHDAEAYLGETVTDAVVTVPAYFNNAQREATKDAGKIAGLNVLRIINEPTAAALAYGLDKEGSDQTILVFDLGGGTFDVSVLELGEGVFEVKSTHRRQPPRRRQLRQGGRRLDGRGVQAGPGHRPDAGQDGTAAPLRGGGEGEDRALVDDDDADQPAVHHGDCRRPEAPRPAAHAGEARGDHGRPARRTVEPTKQALSDAGLESSKIDHVVLVGGMTRMPAVQEKVKELIGKDPHKGVNPDEVVSVGAALQAGVLKGEVKDILLLDVTPLSLGIETRGGVMTKLIERNTTIPTKKSEASRPRRTTSPRSRCTSSRASRRWRLQQDARQVPARRDPTRARGMPQIEVTFDIDANGIINVSAKDMGTGNVQQIQIQGGSGLSEDEVQKMIHEAESHADEAHRLREEADTKNLAETLAYQTERSLKEHRDKLDESEASTIEGRIMELRQALESDDLAEIRVKMDALQESSHKLAEVLYAEAAQQAQASAAGGANGEPSESGDEVVEEGEYEVVDEERRLRRDRRAGQAAGRAGGGRAAAGAGGRRPSASARRRLRELQEARSARTSGVRPACERASDRGTDARSSTISSAHSVPPRSTRKRRWRRASGSSTAHSRGCSSVTV